MFTDFEYAGKRLSDFGYTICKFGGSSDLTDVEIGCDITFSTVKNNHSSIYYNTSSSYENVYTTSLEIMKDPCNKNQDEMYHINEEISMLTSWLNRREYHKFKPLTDEDNFYSVHYYGSFNVKEKTINDRVVGFLLSFTGNAPYGFGEHIINEIDMDYNDMITSGDVVTTTDSAKVKPKNIKLFGKSTQIQYEGNQLLNANDVTKITTNGVTFMKDGDYISVQGTGTGSYNISYDIPCVLPAGTKVYFYMPEGDKSNITFYFRDANKGLIDNTNINPNGVYTPSQDVAYFRIGCKEATYNTKLKIMITTKENAEWEPYVGNEQSPSINYPQEVTPIGEGGSIGGKVLTSQLIPFPYSTTYSQNPTVKNGLTIDVQDDGRIKISGTATSDTYFNLIASKTPKDIAVGEYYALINAVGVDYKYICVTQSTNTSIHTSQSFSVTEDGATFYSWIGIKAGTTVNTTVEIMISKGSEPKPYEPYTEQPFTALTPNGFKSCGDVADEISFSEGKHLHYINRKFITRDDYITANTTNEDYNMFVFTIHKNYHNPNNCVSTNLPVMCNKFIGMTSGTIEKGKCRVATTGDYGWKGDARIYFYTDKTITTIDEFMNAVGDDMYVDYILAEPIVTDMSEEELAQYNALIMNYPNTTIVNDEGAYMEVTYLQDYDNEFVICGISDEYGTMYPNISITCKQDGDLRIKNTITGNLFEVLNCSEGETIYINGEHKFIDSDNKNHKSTTLFNDFNYNYLDTKVTEDDFSKNIYETSMPCKIVIDYSPIRKVGL